MTPSLSGSATVLKGVALAAVNAKTDAVATRRASFMHDIECPPPRFEVAWKFGLASKKQFADAQPYSGSAMV